MAAMPMNRVLHHFRRAGLLPEGTDRTDGQLLECFLTQHDAAALEVLVRRHGPMVWGVCRRVLRNHHDAEDAFQATFLVLVRKAASVRPREMLANWLYGVAHNIARKAKAQSDRRREKEKQVAEMPEPEVVQCDPWNDLQPLLDEELSRLPDTYRVAIVLCDLEGKTRKEAARQLGWPEGTLHGRLARARAILARRLARRGLVLSGGALTAVLLHHAVAAAAPASLTAATVKTMTLVATGQSAAGISASVTALTEGVLKAMFLTRLKVLAVLLVVAAAGAGAGGLIYYAQAGEPAKQSGISAQGRADEQKDKQPDEQPRVDDLLEQARQRQLIEEQRLTQVVEANLRKARDSYPDDSGSALKLLRDTLLQVWDHPDIGERVRNDLLSQLLASRRELGREERNEVGRPIWNLDLRFKDPCFLTVDIPGRGKRTILYLRYEVVNHTGQPRTFVPDFEVQAADKPGVPDQVLPHVVHQVAKVEDPAGKLDLKNSVTITKAPIPPANADTSQQGVMGVAIFDGVDPPCQRFSIFVGGLSNAWSVSDPVPPAKEPVVRRKTLQLNFKRVDDKMVFVPPAQWVYRLTKLVAEDHTRKDQPTGEEKSSPAVAAQKPPRVQVRIASPAGMKVWTQTPEGRFDKAPPIEVPGRLNLEAGRTYRLKLADIPDRPGLVVYPTLQILPVAPKAKEFLNSSALPIEFTGEDFERVAANRTVTKVISLQRDPEGGPDEVVAVPSQKTSPEEAVEEARGRGTVLAVLYLGNIDLEEGGRGAASPRPPGGEKPADLTPNEQVTQLVEKYRALPDAAKLGAEGDRILERLHAVRGDLSPRSREAAALVRASHHLRHLERAIRNNDPESVKNLLAEPDWLNRILSSIEQSRSQWEYRAVTEAEVRKLGQDDLAAGLSKLGEESWELVGVEKGRFLFKRPR